MRLRTKFVLVLLFVTVVMGGGVFVGFDHLRDQSVARAQTNVDHTATATAAQIDTQVRHRRDRVARAAAQPGAERFNYTERFLERFLRNSPFRTARIVAANGTVIDYRGDISAETRNAEVGTDMSDRSYIQRARNGEVTISPVSCDSTCEFTIAAPIYAGTQVKGVLTATATLERAGVFAPVTLAESGQRTLQVTTTHDGTQMVLEERTRTFDRPITATATVETTGWTVSVARSRTALNQHLQSMLYIEAVSLLLVLGAVVTLGGWEYRATLQQTDRLLDGFTALRGGNYDHQLSLTAAEEWRQVSDGFNELVDGIREREERLQILSRVLRHNLRTDLTVILGNARKIKQLTDDSQIQHACEQIIEASESIDDQGDTAREIETAMAEPSTARETIDVAAHLRSVIDDLQTAYPGVSVEMDVPASMSIDAPPGTDLALEQICENAFEHNTADDPRVRIETNQMDRDGDSRVAIAVADNGPGIPEQDRQVVMAAEETPLEHSSGLGLWFVRWLVERADGSLDLSTNKTGGALVTIEFPDE